jgi:hypothetical protein
MNSCVTRGFFSFPLFLFWLFIVSLFVCVVVVLDGWLVGWFFFFFSSSVFLFVLYNFYFGKLSVYRDAITLHYFHRREKRQEKWY